MSEDDLNSPVDPETLLSHLRSSHANVQDVIKFIDTKTGALTGLTTITLTVPYLVIKFFVGEEYKAELWCNPFPSIANFPLYGLILLGFSFLCGLLSICCSIESLVARPPSRWRADTGKGASPSRFCILFPFYSPNQTEEAKQYFSKIVSGLSRGELLSEYQHQTEQLGSIVQRKILWHRRAVGFFWGQLIFPIILMLPYNLLNFVILKLDEAWIRFKEWRKAKSKKSPSKRRVRKRS